MMRRDSVALFATAALLFATILFARTAARRIPEQLKQPLSTISTSIDGWQATGDRMIERRVLNKLTPTSYLQRTYRKRDASIDLFIAYYAEQKAGESMHSPKHCLPGTGWEIWKHDSAQVTIGGRTETVNKYSIENSGTRMLMFYWYQSSSGILASEYLGKILLARDTLLTGRTAASIVRVVLPDTPEAAQDGLAFITALIPEVHRCITGSPELAARH